ncbi:5-dehydro-2-deoxygluconokinase [Acidocella aquatica]|uniref:5-dehydro-2-deoxygluconokinase n=1 Tax=Acidocella aquatica TaxID=1922313 RepID=A0ABQ6A961_9PROT|nr:PfkB family carbohydrate kinase [Acidocella aquatica]GLR67132.1 5-dehydro-2-deoxygluconokinase [Acidocella aquatica]
MPEPALDVVTLGRAGMDLYGQQTGTWLADMGSFVKSVGGTPANVAVGCARLGLRAAIITAVGADPLGEAIIAQFIADGVETRGVRRDTQRPTALAIAGVGPGGAVQLHFWRENCADMGLRAGMLDASLLTSARALVLTGTHASTPEVYAASLHAAALARAAGARVVLDIDFREQLWTSGERAFVSARLSALMEGAALVCGTAEEWCVAGAAPDPFTAMRRLREVSDALFILKHGAEGATLVTAGPETGQNFPAWPVRVVNPLGAGDAFLAGFLSRWLRGASPEAAMPTALACGAIAAGRLLCANAYPGPREVALFMAGTPLDSPVMADAKRFTARRRAPATLRALAIDHRPQLAALARHPAQIGTFKALALRAVAAEARGRRGYGLLLDHIYGGPARGCAEADGLWIAAPVEQPGSRPLAFTAGLDLGGGLASWPATETLKCLVTYGPDDEPALRAAQDEALLRLQEAAVAAGREYLVEILPPRGGVMDETAAPRLIEHFYRLGLHPDWWKLPVQPNPVWAVLEGLIPAADPACRGVLVLGGDHEAEILEAGLSEAAAYGLVAGFAIGRAIWAEPAAAYFAGRAAGDEVQAMLQARFARFSGLWDRLRGEAA